MHKVNTSTIGKTFSSIILILLFFFGQNIFGYFKHNYTSVFAEDKNITYFSFGKGIYQNKSAVHSAVSSEGEETEVKKFGNGSEVDFFGSLFSHLHNKIVHFPVALIVISFLFSLLQLKWKNLDLSIKFLVPIAFFTSILAIVTGKFQEEAFENTPKEYLVEIHEKFGYATATLSLLWTAFLFNSKLHKYHLIIGFIIFIVVSIAGFYGGLIAH
jgi:uncharacterized membrane protein